MSVPDPAVQFVEGSKRCLDYLILGKQTVSEKETWVCS
jgi:hypothetical protein